MVVALICAVVASIVQVYFMLTVIKSYQQELRDVNAKLVAAASGSSTTELAKAIEIKDKAERDVALMQRELQSIADSLGPISNKETKVAEIEIYDDSVGRKRRLVPINNVAELLEDL